MEEDVVFGQVLMKDARVSIILIDFFSRKVLTTVSEDKFEIIWCSILAFPNSILIRLLRSNSNNVEVD